MDACLAQIDNILLGRAMMLGPKLEITQPVEKGWAYVTWGFICCISYQAPYWHFHTWILFLVLQMLLNVAP